MARAFEILIRGGLVVDGSGAAPRPAELAVAGGQIAAIGPRLDGDAALELDASGCLVLPGLIDMHSHADLSIAAVPDAPLLLQGVTTLVVGNCGLTAFPLEPSRRAELESYLDPFLPAAHRGSFAWRDLDGYFAEALGEGSGVNLAPLCGHGSVRLAVLGFSPGEASPAALAEMTGLLERALAQGALGLSLGLLYPPGSFASRAELHALASTTAAAGGLLAVHLRNEGDGLCDAVEEAIAIAEAARVRLHLSHHKAVGRANWGKVARTLEAIEAACRRGVAVSLDVWPYTSGSTTVTALLPPFMLEGGRDAALARLADPAARARARDELERGAIPGEDLIGLLGWAGIRLAECPARRELEGRSLAEIFAARGQSGEPWDAFFALLHELELRATMILWEELDEADLERVIRSPRACLGSDSWPVAAADEGRPHPRGYGAFTRFLRRYALDRGLLPLGEAVRRVTGLPADCANLAGRGRLAPGLAADIAVLDPERLEERATFEAPKQTSAGVRHLLVNGALAVRDGQLTGLRAGRLLRRVTQTPPARA
jgi:N-acyl-D-aspartate/D-glutamate deacylase